MSRSALENSKDFSELVHEELWPTSELLKYLFEEDPSIHKLEFEICHPSSQAKTRWQSGFRTTANKALIFFLKLQEQDKSFPIFSAKWGLYISSFTRRDHFGAINEFNETMPVSVGQEILLDLKCNKSDLALLFFRPREEPVARVKTVITLQVLKESLSHGEQKFSRSSGLKLRQDFAQLLAQSEKKDLKIVCSDGVELQAHRNIVKVRNQVFESMLRSEMSEKQTGVVKVDDLTGATMKIVLNYFYTGELLPEWKEPEIIHEFVYASGKYQLIEVLQMLNDVLGTDTVPTCDIKLLALVNKLGLENADARISEKLCKRFSQAKGGKQLLELVGKIE